MTDEGFLNALRKHPNDDTTRLVYADWLEEQEDEESRYKAAYIRHEQSLPPDGSRKRERARFEKVGRRLAYYIDSAWLAVVSKPAVEFCTFRFECPKKWNDLQPVEGSDTKRFCDECRREVHYCSTLELARRHATKGHCIAIDARCVPRPGGGEDSETEVMGEIAPDGFE